MGKAHGRYDAPTMHLVQIWRRELRRADGHRVLIEKPLRFIHYLTATRKRELPARQRAGKAINTRNTGHGANDKGLRRAQPRDKGGLLHTGG